MTTSAILTRYWEGFVKRKSPLTQQRQDSVLRRLNMLDTWYPAQVPHSHRREAYPGPWLPISRNWEGTSAVHWTEMVQPLRKLMDMKKCKGSKKLTWTDEAIEAFHFCQVAVSNCQELYFLEDTATPILQTDASDYGIGGYMYMIVNHQVGSQLNWSACTVIMVSFVFKPRRPLMCHLFKISSWTFLSFVSSTSQEMSLSFTCVTVSLSLHQVTITQWMTTCITCVVFSIPSSTTFPVRWSFNVIVHWDIECREIIGNFTTISGMFKSRRRMMDDKRWKVIFVSHIY